MGTQPQTGVPQGWQGRPPTLWTCTQPVGCAHQNLHLVILDELPTFPQCICPALSHQTRCGFSGHSCTPHTRRSRSHGLTRSLDMAAQALPGTRLHIPAFSLPDTHMCTPTRHLPQSPCTPSCWHTLTQGDLSSCHSDPQDHPSSQAPKSSSHC